MRVAIMGMGAGGAAAAVELSLAGHSVALWNRSAETIQPFRDAAGVGYEGVLGAGLVRPDTMTSDAAEAVAGAAAVVICLPTFLHRGLGEILARVGLSSETPIILNPGHTGGALEFADAFRAASGRRPRVCEFSTLSYVARKYNPAKVTITSRAKHVKAATLPGASDALAIARQLFPGVQAVRDVLACDLSNVNMVLHPPGAVLGAAWIEARGGDFTFYVEGMTGGVARVMSQLDHERRQVAAAFGHDLPSLIMEMQAIGTVEDHIKDGDDLTVAVGTGTANRAIKAPDSLQHRYYKEDFGFGLLPLCEFAAIARIQVPTAQSLLALGATLTGVDYRASGRTAERMGIGGLDVKGVVARVRE